MSDNYFDNRDEINIEKIREILEELPTFVSEFFLGIQMRTSNLTRLNYAYDLRVFFNYLSKKKFKIPSAQIVLADLELIEPLDIELFMDYLSAYNINGKKYKCGESAKERKLSTLRSFFKYYYKKDKLSQNITVKVDMPKIHDKSILILEPDEVNDVLQLADDGEKMSKMQKAFHQKTRYRDVAILTLLLGTGIRISECVGLNKNDIDFNINAINITRKGGNKTILYFSDEVCSALTDYINWLNTEKKENTSFNQNISNSDALFLSMQGTRLGVRAIELMVKKYSSIIAPLKKITPHKLRSTFGTSLYRETGDIYVVADVLGHKDVNTTKKHYAAMSDTVRRKAANAVKLKKED